MSKVKIKLVRGRAGKTKRQLATLDSLGLNKPGKEVVKEVNDAINGMIKKVKHLVAIEEIEEWGGKSNVCLLYTSPSPRD